MLGDTLEMVGLHKVLSIGTIAHLASQESLW